jgi:hypothetical protein
MNINNVTEFKNFVNINQLRDLNRAFDAVSICMMDYERSCDCWNNKGRQQTYENCKKLYEAAVSTIVSSYKANFLAHTADQMLSFYQDGRLIASIRR